MKNILLILSKISLASFLNIISNIFKTKFTATILSTIGISISAQLGNFSSMLTFIFSFGFSVGLINYIAILNAESRITQINYLIKQIFILYSISCFTIIPVLVYFAVDLSYLLFDDSNYNLLIAIIAFSIPFNLYNIIFDSLIKGTKSYNHYTKISVISNVITTVLSIILIFKYGLLGIALGFFISSAFGTIIYFAYCWKYRILNYIKIIRSKKENSGQLKRIFYLGIASLIIGFLDQFIQLLIRIFIIKSLDLQSNGLYQCVFGISNNYIGFFFLTLGIYYLPTLASLKLNNEINEEINNIIKFSLLVLVPVVVTAIVFRHYIILIIYSNEFINAEYLLKYYLIGDLFKAGSWIIGSWVIAHFKYKAWIIIDLISYFTLFSVFYLLIIYFNFNLLSIVIAYIFSYFLKFSIHIIYLHKTTKFRLINNNVLIVMYSIILILILFLITSNYLTLSYFLITPLILLFYYLTINKYEIQKIKSLLFK